MEYEADCHHVSSLIQPLPGDSFLNHLRNLLFAVAIASLCLCSIATAQDTPVGSKGRYFCSVDGSGIASLFRVRNSNVTRVGLKATRRLARQKIKKLRLKNRTRKINEWRLVISGIKECILQNDMTAACSIFGGVESESSIGPVAPRIIDGSECTRGDSPIVLVRMFDSFGDSLGTCSGTVLTDNVVLTAAHCFADNFGDLEADYAEVETGDGRVTSTQLVVHPNYNPQTDPLEENDVAIFITNETIKTQVLTLHPDTDLAKFETIATAGFGLTETGSTAGLRAGFMYLRSVTTESIEARYFPGTGANTCNGDSGGPLTVKRGNQWYLAGVVSNGDNFTCGRNKRQDISRWANVTSQSNRNFIEQYAPELF